MEAVDGGHARPQEKVLGLRREEPLPPAAPTEAPEHRAEHGPVREVRGDAERAPALTVREGTAEQANVRVLRPEEAAQERLGGRPGGRGDDPGGDASAHEGKGILAA